MKWWHPVEKPGQSTCWWFSSFCLFGKMGPLPPPSSFLSGIDMEGSWVHSDVCGGCREVN